MEAKTLIENLIEAIGEITRTCEDANGPIVPTPVAEAIADAKESASLAKLILPSLDAPPAPPPAAMLVVIDADADECYGPFPNDVAAQTFIDTLASVNDVQMMDVKPPANPGGSAPAPAAPQAPQQSYDEVLDDLKAERWRGTPGSVISNKPAGSLYKQ